MLTTVTDAIHLCLKDLPLQPAQQQKVSTAPLVIARDVLAPTDHPLFDQSAVDGYALRHEDFAAGKVLQLVEEIRAGAATGKVLGPGECMRIFTGGAVPPGADTVVMQEFTTVNGAEILIHDEKLKPGGNIRRKGEQIQKGGLALEAGERLNPAMVGFLASLGLREIEVREPPRVRILVTGDEFASGEGDLELGMIYESNGQMLQTALAQEGIQARFETVRDDLATTTEKIRAASAASDLLLITGGVSVGDYDFTRPALEENGFEVIFHKVNQKPGKPLLYARKGNISAFGLPGNPRSVLVGYYMYVLPHLHQRMGAKQVGLRQIRLPLSHHFRKQDDGKTHFLTGTLGEKGVSILSGQASHMLQSFARAQALVTLPAEQTEYLPGTELVVYLLPS